MNSSDAELWMSLAVLCLAGFLYFLPAIVGKLRNHHNSDAILILNLFLGWTLLGWVIALVWAATNTRPRVEN